MNLFSIFFKRPWSCVMQGSVLRLSVKKRIEYLILFSRYMYINTSKFWYFDIYIVKTTWDFRSVFAGRLGILIVLNRPKLFFEKYKWWDFIFWFFQISKNQKFHIWFFFRKSGDCVLYVMINSKTFCKKTDRKSH